MAQKRKPTSRKKAPAKRKSNTQKKGGSSFGRYFLGILILVAMAYGVLAFQDEQLVPDILKGFNLSSPSLEEQSLDTEPKKPIETPKAEEKAATEDDQPERDLESFDLYFTKAFDFMWPDYEADQMIFERPYYTLRYSDEHEQAMWVAYSLKSDSIAQTKVSYDEDYRKDPRVRTGSALPRDYRNSGYDMGQLAPVNDFNYDTFGAKQTFYMSNISPQNESFRTGIWKRLEDQTRAWARKNGEVYVVTGPVLRRNLPRIGTSNVTVPEYFYKIVLDIAKPDIKAIAFLIKNEGSNGSLDSLAVSIDEIEQLTGLDFFPSMSDELEQILESEVNLQGWF